jgi:hypothetical protein
MHPGLRWTIGIFAVAGLLALAFAMSQVWVQFNLLTALAAILLTVAFTRAARLRWLLAAVAALIIARPPYPHQVLVTTGRLWHLHFLNDVPFLVATLCVVYLVAFALFAALFWVLPRPVQKWDGGG